MSSALVIDSGRYWAGVLATALVAALAAVLGVVVLDDLAGIDVLAPPIGPRHVGWVSAAVVAAVVAGGLLYVLVLTTPRPRVFFGWIVFLVTATGAVSAFTTADTTDSGLATAGLTVLVGLVVGTSVAAVAGRTVRPAPAPAR